MSLGSLVPFVIPLIVIGLIVWVLIALRGANRNDGAGSRSYSDRRDDSQVVDTGRELLKTLAIVAVIALGVVAILCGTCMSTIRL